MRLNYLKVVLFIALVFSSCKKEPADYREAYTGQWCFDVELSSFNIEGEGTYTRDSLVYSGAISLGGSDDEILISYVPEHSITLAISPNGELSGFPTHYCSGYFTGNQELHLYLRWGGLGGGVTHIVDGKKSGCADSTTNP